MSEIRTRFAPSPTGWLHIGGIRSALYPYLFARANGGKFIIRIEDTDKKREVEGAIDFIFNSLKLAGLDWDEAADVGGDYGPYIQSERKEIYQKYAHELVALDGGYYCFCDENHELAKGELDPCRSLDKNVAKAGIDSGEKFVVRQKIPQDGETTYYDVVYGKITFPNKDLSEGVMLKSDGLPTYNFANVIDDYLMKISHVMRGNEYLSSTPKYELIYKAFGWNSPKYIHLTPIMKDRHKKLSKRDASASFMDLVNKGYLPEAIVNYVALSGWRPPGDRELYTIPEMIKVFSLKGLQKSPALFDQEKLDWMNSQYLKKLSLAEFHQRALEFYTEVVKQKCDVEYLSSVLHNRLNYLGQIPEETEFLIRMPEYDKSLYVNERMGSTLEITRKSVEAVIPKLEPISDWKEKNIKDAMFNIVEELDCKVGQVLWPLRIALSGKQFTPGGAVEIAAIIGKEKTLERLQVALKKLN